MNEQLQNALSELINKSMELGGDALAFTQEQLPEVIQQLLVWKMVESLGSCLAWLALGSVVLIAAHRWRRHIVKEGDAFYDGSEKPSVFMAYTFAGMLAILGLALARRADLDWIQIWLAPKVYLLEYAAQLTR